MKSIIELATEAGFEHYDQFPADYQNKIQRFAALLKSEWLADAGEMPAPVGYVSEHTSTGMWQWQFNKTSTGVYKDTAKTIDAVFTLTQCQQAVVAAVARKDAELTQTHADWVRCDKAYHELKAERDALKALVNQQLTTEQVQRAKQALYDASHGDLEATDDEVKAALEASK